MDLTERQRQEVVTHFVVYFYPVGPVRDLTLPQRPAIYEVYVVSA